MRIGNLGVVLFVEGCRLRVDVSGWGQSRGSRKGATQQFFNITHTSTIPKIFPIKRKAMRDIHSNHSESIPNCSDLTDSEVHRNANTRGILETKR
jgi:hypothetical protein